MHRQLDYWTLGLRWVKMTLEEEHSYEDALLLGLQKNSREYELSLEVRCQIHEMLDSPATPRPQPWKTVDSPCTSTVAAATTSSNSTPIQ